MINFLRRIRRDLINENKTSVYLIYAVGEIVLVVIGILIALQVSNWNEQRKNANAEEALLIDLKTELEVNIEALKITIDHHQKSLDAALEVRSLLPNQKMIDSLSHEDLYSLHLAMTSVSTFDPKLGILSSTINSGKMDLIQNKEIRYRMSSIKESIIDAFESNKLIERNRESLYWPHIAFNEEIVNYEPFIPESKKRFSDSRFAWWTEFLIHVRNQGLDEENELLDFLIEIRQLIEQELN